MSNIIDIEAFRRKKQDEEDMSRGRRPLYISHLENKASGNAENFGDRLSRVRESLKRINELMDELKRISNKDVIETKNKS